MIEKIVVAWNDNFENDGLLYFAQRIVEMLDYTTIDIYRTPLLNSRILIREYLNVENGASQQYNLDKILEEFKDSFKNDIVISHNWGDERITQIMHRLNNDSNKKSTMEYLEHAIGSSYFRWVVDYLKLIVPQSRQKKKIERAVRCFIPQLLFEGYSRDEIYHFTKEIFYKNDIDSVTILETYLARYNRKKASYNVYIGVSNKILRFKDVLEKRLSITFEDDGNFAKLDVWRGFCVAKRVVEKAYDASAAAEIVYRNIDLFTSFYQFFGNYAGNLIQNKTMVISEDGKERKLTINRGKYNSYEEEDTLKIGELSELCITSLMKGAQCSLEQLNRITKLHNRAISGNGLENGFLNLWSILEMICIDTPVDSKITKVIDITVPILQHDYLPTVLNDISQNLKSVLAAEDYSKLLESICDGTKDYEKIANFILLEKYSEDFDKFVDCLVNYPVLRTRILSLHDDCTHRNTLHNLAVRYAKRITWHIYRIYRARNTITHTGKCPKNIKDLGEHLHTYVDAMSSQIIIKLAMGGLCHIRNIHVDSELAIERFNTYFSQKEPIDADAIHKLFDTQMEVWANAQ